MAVLYAREGADAAIVYLPQEQSDAEVTESAVADKPAQKAAKHGSDVPMTRPGQPEEVAPTHVFFASNVDSSYITGRY